MRSVVTAADMRRLEQAAVDGGEASYDELMERAGAAVVDVLRERYLDDCSSVTVLCGNGNNGGDGYVIARILRRIAPSLTVHTVRVVGVATTALAAAKEALVDDVTDVFDGSLDEHSVVVDAVYGIGFHGQLPMAVTELFAVVAAHRCPVIAVDIPSGVRADSGEYDPASLRADVTVTFTAEKPAFVLPISADRCGEVMVADVGISRKLVDQFATKMSPVTDDMVKERMPLRPSDGHKGTFGGVLSVCGCYGMAGAAMLSGKAALRMGVGLLHMALPRSVYPIVAGQIWEAVYHPMNETPEGSFAEDAADAVLALTERMQSMLIGCGLSRRREVEAFVSRLLDEVSVPLVLDADGLNVTAPHIHRLKAITSPLVITPHPAEAARLLETDVRTVERDRVSAAKRLACDSGAVVVLKGHRTIVADADGNVFINTNGNSGMATGGSGDVLSGMIAALLAQGLCARDAALCGVYLHGKAGDETARHGSKTAMLPTDMLDTLARLLSHYERGE